MKKLTQVYSACPVNALSQPTFYVNKWGYP